MRHRSLSLRLLPLAFACGLSHAALAANAGNGAPPVASDSRVKTFVFNENDVYSLLTYYGFQSNIEFGPKEKIETVSIGDRAGWQVVPAGRRLFIRAVADKLHTNMTVVTNERAYQFDLRATNPAELPQEELAYVIRFYYPDDPKNSRPASAAIPTAPMAAPLAPVAYPTGMASSAPVASVSPAMAPMNAPISSTPLPMPPLDQGNSGLPAPQPKPMMAASMRDSALHSPPAGNTPYGSGPFDTPVSNASPAPATMAAPAPAAKNGMNFNYTYEGSGQLLPYALFDDGKRTFFQFINSDTVPALSRVSNSGKETPVPLKHEGNYWVAGGVGSKFVLRPQGQKGPVGQQVVIYNETRQPK